MVLAARKHFAGKQGLTGIEIGTAKGDNAVSILQELPLERLYLIDPYSPFEDALGHGDYSDEYPIAYSKLAEYQQVRWLKKTSESARGDFQDKEMVDFIYIDGNHSYESVKADLASYFPLVRNNGLLGGHDYTPFYESVMRAVQEFANQSKLELHVVFPDWWFIVKR